MTDLSLDDAALALLSENGRLRDQAERVVLEHKTAAPAALVGVLERTPISGDLRVGRIALLVGAFRARDALMMLCERVVHDKTHVDDRPLLARAICEIVDGRDAFDDRVTSALESMSQCDDRFVRAFAAKAYGALGDARSRGRIEALAEDADEWVSDQAGAQLRRLDEAQRLTETGGLDFAALVQQANDEGGHLKAWLDDLDDARRAVRDAATVALIKAGKEAVPFLIDKLNQPKTKARIGAATALGQIQSSDAVSALVIAATAPAQTPLENELRPVALRALANCLTGLEDGLCAALLPLSEDDDRFVRAAAMLCLGRLADREGMKRVVGALSEKDPFVVEAAAIALSEGVREEDIELVLPLLDAFDTRPRRGMSALREAILIALSRIIIENPALRVRVRHRIRLEVTGPTAALRKAAVALLERLYDEDDPPPPPATDVVLSRLRDAHPEVRLVAASYLSRHLEPGFSGALRHIGEALKTGERTISLLCLDAVVRHDTIGAKKLLEETTTHADTEVAIRAAELVEQMSPSSTEWIFVSDEKVAQRTGLSPTQTAPKVQRPSRVKSVDATADDTAGKASADDDDGRDVVGARFD